MSTSNQRPNLKTIMKELADKFGSPGLTDWVKLIEDPLDCTDPAERAAVIQRNLNLLKNKLDIFDRFGRISTESAKQFVENPGNFDYEEWQSLENIKGDINDYEATITIETQKMKLENALQASEKGQQSEEASKPKKRAKRKMGSYPGWIPS